MMIDSSLVGTHLPDSRLPYWEVTKLASPYWNPTVGTQASLVGKQSA